MFEWGRPLLGGSSDEEDYGEEDEGDGEDRGRQPLVLESAAPVYLEKEPSEVSIPLQSSVRKIVKPEEVIEEYVDEEGRQVKRISKVTTTKTITRSERRLPTQKMDVDVPSEPGEDVEEYTDENGQRVRRVVRTSFTTTPKTVLRDGAVKVVLKPGDRGQRELREGPEETERIHTFTSDDGHRTQKLTKTTLTTRLKRTVQPVTVQLPSPASLPIHDDNQPPMDQDENVNLARVERNVSYPEWLETVKEKPSTPKEISLSSIQVEPLQPVLPTVHVPERPYIVEELSATVVERHRPEISLLGLEEEKESPEIRDRKRVEPPEGLSGISEIPRKRAHKEPSPMPPTERDADPQVEIDDKQEGDETSEDDDADEFNEEIVVLEVKRRPRVPKWFGVVPDEPEEPLKADGLDYPKRITSSDSQVKEKTEIKEDLSCINIERKVTIPVLSSSFDNEEPMEVDKVKDDPHQTVKKEARQIEPVEVTFPVVPSEDESPEDVEEYVDENGVRVRRIVRRTITTTTTIKRDDQGIEGVEIISPVLASEDESPEEIQEYIDENGVRVRRIVRRTITTAAITREGQQIQPLQVTFPVVLSEDGSPEEVEEYVDENGVRVRRIVRRTITTRRIIRTSVDEARDDLDTKVFESAAPVYLDSDDVVPSVQTRKVVLPEWMEESERASEEPRQPAGDISSLILPSQPKEPGSKEDLGHEDVMERVTSTTLNREIVFPEIDGVEGEPTEEGEEYVDENGARERRIVRRTITTTTINREGQLTEPGEVKFPVALSEEESPEDVEEYIDENGVRVRRIVKRIVTTANVKREGPWTGPEEVESPVTPSEDESPEEVEEYIDENGIRVRRIVRRTITTRSIIRTSVDEAKDGSGAKTFQSAAPVYLDSDDVVPSLQTREVVLPEWMEESEPESEEPRQPAGDISFSIVPLEPKEPGSKEDLDYEDVMESVTSTRLNREIVIPEIEGMEDESPEEVEEYLDENGVQVRRVVRKAITTTSIKREGQRTEPAEVKFPVVPSEGESPEEVEEYIDEDGVRVRRIVKRTIATATIKREGAETGPEEVKFPVTPFADESPEEVEEYIDENGVRVRRIARRTITTRSIIRTSVDEAKDHPGTKVFESAAPVYLDSDDIVPSQQTRDVVLPEWMEESEPASKEPRQPAGDISFLIMPSEPKEPGSKEDLDHEDVMERVTSTTLNREIVIPEIDGMEGEPSEEVEEYVDENGVRVRRIVRKTITTTSINREGQQTEPVEGKFPVARSEGESPEEVEEYIDENGAQVRRIVKRTITTAAIKREGPGTGAEEVEFPVTPSEDESPEDVEEYVDENDVRVRRIVRRTITTKSIIRTSVDEAKDGPGAKLFESAARAKREGPEIGLVEVKFPPTPSEDESPEEFEEYIDENGVVVRRIVRRTITTRSVIRTSVDEAKDHPSAKMFQSAAPVYLDSDDVVPSVQTREVVLPEWMEESEPASEEPRQPAGDISFLIMPSEPKEPGSKEDPDHEDVMERVTSTTLNREIVIPEIDGMEGEPSEEVEEYVDENGVRVRRIVRKTITTTSINREGQRTEPVEVKFPVARSEGECPEEVEEYIDENGVRVRRIVKRTITTASIKREGPGTGPEEVKFPVTPFADESPEEVEEYIDENGVRVRRIVRRTITTRSIIRTSVDEAKDHPGTKVFESAAPVYLDSDDIVPSQQTRDVVLPEWMEESEPASKEPRQPAGDISFLIMPSEPKEPGSKEDLDHEDVMERVTSTTLNREIVFPKIDGMEGEPSEEVEEYVDENGVRVRRIVRKTITTTSINREGQRTEPVEGKFPVARSEGESPEEVEEYIDENGAQVRRIVKRTITTATIKREGPGTGAEEVEFPVTPSEDESPEDVEEYVDENGVRVRRIVSRTITTKSIIRTSVDEAKDGPGAKLFESATRAKREGPEIGLVEVKFPPTPSEDESPEEFEEYIDENGVVVRRIVRRTITTRSVIRTSVDEAKDDPSAKMFQSAAPVYLDSDDVVPSVQTREVVLPEWMEEGEPASEEPRQPAGEISFLILPSQPKEPGSEEDPDHEDVMERVTSTTLNREIVIPEIEGMEDESPKEVEEYVDENGARVRQIVRRTITTTSIKREGQRTEPAEVKFPVAPSDDEPQEEFEEYIDENGVRVRRIVKRTITTTTTTTTTRRQGHELEPMALEFPAEDREGISPDEFVEEYVNENGVTVKRIVKRTTMTTAQRGVLSEEGVVESEMPVGLYQVTEEVPPRKEIAGVEAITPETALFTQKHAISPRRESIPYETTVVQRYLVIIETLYQYVLEHKSMIFIYSSRYMQFNFVLENFLQWMLVTLKTLSWMRPVSWKVDEIKDQLEQIKVFLSDGMCVDLHNGSQCC